MTLEKSMWLIWDLLAVAVIAWFVWQSAARGLLRTVISILGYVFAGAAAGAASPALATMLYDNVVRDALLDNLVRRLETYVSSQGVAGVADVAVADLVDVFPKSLREFLVPEGGNVVENLLGDDLPALVEQLMDAVLREPVLSLLQGICFVFLFTVISFSVRYLARVLGFINRVPVLGTVNTWLGGILGVLEAGVVLVVAALAVRLLIALSGGGFTWLNEEIIEQAYVLRFFYHLTLW